MHKKDDHVTESIIESDRAQPLSIRVDKPAVDLRAAFDEVCELAVKRQHGIADYDQAVAKVREIRARVS